MSRYCCACKEEIKRWRATTESTIVFAQPGSAGAAPPGTTSTIGSTLPPPAPSPPAALAELPPPSAVAVRVLWTGFSSRAGGFALPERVSGWRPARTAIVSVPPTTTPRPGAGANSSGRSASNCASRGPAGQCSTRYRQAPNSNTAAACAHSPPDGGHNRSATGTSTGSCTTSCTPIRSAASVRRRCISGLLAASARCRTVTPGPGSNTLPDSGGGGSASNTTRSPNTTRLWYTATP
jgi:hypothetical protein